MAQRFGHLAQSLTCLRRIIRAGTVVVFGVVVTGDRRARPGGRYRAAPLLLATLALQRRNLECYAPHRLLLGLLGRIIKVVIPFALALQHLGTSPDAHRVHPRVDEFDLPQIQILGPDARGGS